jgi:hypothetical protein
MSYPPAYDCGSMKPNELITEWHAGIRINVLSHYECSKLFEGYHRSLGYPTVILSALAGTAFVSTLNDSNILWARGFAIVLSLAVTVFASLQTFLRYSERSEKHKSAAAEFGKLRRELEQIIALIPDGDAVSKAEMESIRIRWGELSTHAPAIPNKVYSRMYLKVWHGAGDEVPPPPTL